MMRAQCCICADLFESAQTVNIAATPCGHVFHEACLMRWMDSSSTCPSCRTHIKKTQVIKRLFFDISEDVDTEEDTSHYVNQIGDLKAKLREKDKSMRELVESRDKDQALLAVEEANRIELVAKLSREKSMRDVLQADLERVQRENNLHAQEISALQKKAKRLQELQHVEKILSDCSGDVQEMVSQYSDGGESSIRQLSSLISVMKKEYNKVVAEKRAAKEQLSKWKQWIGTFKSESKLANSEVIKLRGELEAVKKNLGLKEKENDANRRKIVHLKNALHHNKTQGSQSFHEALTTDSPNVAYTPVLKSSSSVPINKDVDQENLGTPPSKKHCRSPDLFEHTPVGKVEKPAIKHCLDFVHKTKDSEEEDGAQTGQSIVPVRESSPDPHTSADRVDPQVRASGVHPKKRNAILSERDRITEKLYSKVSEEDDSPHIPPAMLSIMQKKLTGKSNSHMYDARSSVITRGFDGFGGSTTFVHPQGPLRGSWLKLEQHRKKQSSAGSKKNSNIQRPKVGESQRRLKDCIGSTATALKSTSSSFPSSSSSSSSSSLALGMFTSKGPSLSKLSTASDDGFIDLT